MDKINENVRFDFSVNITKNNKVRKSIIWEFAKD